LFRDGVPNTSITLLAYFGRKGTRRAASTSSLKEVIRIKVSRKMQRHVELKIRHAMATGILPVVERSSGNGAHSKSGTDKSEGNDLSQGK
jgi:hypothetical protein